MKLAFVVLGMHRSGTSSVAGLLAHLGATAPRTLMTAKPENPKGFWESEVIMAFNEEILTRAGSSWDDSRPLDNTIFEGEQGQELRRRAGQKLIEEFGGASTIVLKDPRICRFYPFWEAVLKEQGYTPFPIIPVRPPEEVAASLNGRNKMDINDALALWRRHVVDAERDTRDGPRHILLWQDLLTDWRKTLAGIEASLGQPAPLSTGAENAQADSFLEPGLSLHFGKALPAPDAGSQALFDKMKSLVGH